MARSDITMSRGIAGGGGSGRVYNPNAVYQPTMAEQQGVGAGIPDTMDDRMNLLDRYNDLKAKADARGLPLSFDMAAQLLQVDPQQLGQMAQNSGVPTQPTVPVAQPTMAQQQGTGAPVYQPSMAAAQGTGFVPVERPNMAQAQAPTTTSNPALSMAQAQAPSAPQPTMAQQQAAKPRTSMATAQAPTQQSAQRAKAVNPYAGGTSTPKSQGLATQRKAQTSTAQPSQQQAQSARKATQQQAQQNRKKRQTNRGYGQGRA